MNLAQLTKRPPRGAVRQGVRLRTQSVNLRAGFVFNSERLCQSPLFNDIGDHLQSVILGRRALYLLRGAQLR